MVFDLIRLGTDITRVRKQISVFMQVLSTEEGKKDVAEKMIELVKNHPDSLKKFKPYTYEKNYPHLLNLSGRVIKNLLLPLGNMLMHAQYTVNPFTSYVLEFLFSMENENDKTIALESKNILVKINSSFNTQALILSQLFSNLNLEDETNLELLPEKFDSFMTADDPDFDYYFALTLRQTSTERVNDFLEFQQGFWDEKDKFITFLQAVLIGQEDIIPEKNRRVTQLWIDEKRSEMLEKANHLTSHIVNIQSNIVNFQGNIETGSTPQTAPVSKNKAEDVENRNFDIPPFQAFTIPGRLNPKIIRRFFTFLSKENNGTNQPFATDEAIMRHLDSYGLQVPLSPLSERFDLNLSPKRSKQVIYHCIYELYSKHSSNENHKHYFAMLLKHTFMNFDKITSIENLASHIRPYELSPKQMNFDIGQYLRKSD